MGTLRDATFVQFTANGQMLLVARKGVKSVTLWHVNTGDETTPLKALAGLSAVALSADSRYLVQHYGHLAAPPDDSLLAWPGEKQCWVWRIERLVP